MAHLVPIVAIHCLDCLAGTRLIDSALADLRRKVSALLSAKWALDHDGLEWKLLRATRDIAAALFAAHNEGPSPKDHAVRSFRNSLV